MIVTLLVRLAAGQAPAVPAPAVAPSSNSAAAVVPASIPTTYRAPNAPSIARRSRRSGHVRLDYQLGKGSAPCDSEELFRKILTAELKEPDPFVPVGPVDAVVTLRLERDGPGFRGTMELADLTGTIVERTSIVERTCPDAADRLILDLMMRVFPAEQLPAPGPAADKPYPSEEVVKILRELRLRLDAQEETIEKQAEALAELRKALAEERKRKMDLTFALSAGALMTANLTSNVGPGVWLGGDVRTGPISVGLEARAVLPAPVFLPPYDFDVSQIVALLTPCGRYSVVFGCAVAGAGGEIHLDSNRVGFKDEGQSSGPVLHLGGRLGAEYFFGDTPLGARAWAEVLYSAPRAGTYYRLSDGRTLTWTRPDVSAFFGLGLVIRFGGDSASQGAR